MPDLPDYYTASLLAWTEIAGIKGGLDADKAAAPVAKDVYAATDTKKLWVCYVAGTWTDVTYACLLLAGGTMTGAIAMGSHKVTGLAAPTNAGDAARKAYVDLFTLLTTFNNHSARHENDGADEVNVAGLTGVLANDQHVIDAEAVAAMGALGDGNALNHDKYTDAAAKAAAVLAGAITNGETKAPTHDAVYDVKVTADAALPTGSKYTDAEAKAAAVQAGAITNAVTKAPTHDAVYDVKATADAAQPAATDAAAAVTAMGALGDANPLNHNKAAEWGATEHTAIGDAAPHHAKYTNAEAVDAIEADGNLPVASITFIFDGGGSVLTGGLKGLLEIPFACTINRVTLVSIVDGSVTIDIWKGTYAEWPFASEKSIVAVAAPTITSARKSQDSTLTDWTTAIAAGNLLAFSVTSCTTIPWLLLSLKVTKT